MLCSFSAIEWSAAGVFIKELYTYDAFNKFQRFALIEKEPRNRASPPSYELYQLPTPGRTDLPLLSESTEIITVYRGISWQGAAHTVNMTSREEMMRQESQRHFTARATPALPQKLLPPTL